MKKRTYFIMSVLIVFTALIYIGCKKENEDNTNTAGSQRAAIDNSTAENLFDDIFKQVDNAAKQTNEAGAKQTLQLDTSGCATVTITPFDTTTWPKTLTIDFGSTNCLGSDLKYRRGKIIATLSGRYRDSASVITITLDQYYVNDYHVEGTKTVTNLGHVGTYGNGNNLKYAIVVNNAKITPPDGSNSIFWSCLRTREWIEGESTLINILDDVYLIDGTESGIDANGTNYTVTITSPLRVALNCRWIESGIIEINQGQITYAVDFGNGDCDNDAIVTFNGTPYNFIMQ